MSRNNNYFAVLDQAGPFKHEDLLMPGSDDRDDMVILEECLRELEIAQVGRRSIRGTIAYRRTQVAILRVELAYLNMHTYIDLEGVGRVGLFTREDYMAVKQILERHSRLLQAYRNPNTPLVYRKLSARLRPQTRSWTEESWHEATTNSQFSTKTSSLRMAPMDPAQAGSDEELNEDSHERFDEDSDEESDENSDDDSDAGSYEGPDEGSDGDSVQGSGFWLLRDGETIEEFNLGFEREQQRRVRELELLQAAPDYMRGSVEYCRVQIEILDVEADNIFIFKYITLEGIDRVGLFTREDYVHVMDILHRQMDLLQHAIDHGNGALIDFTRETPISLRPRMSLPRLRPGKIELPYCRLIVSASPTIAPFRWHVLARLLSLM
ncbi:hypothetical protein TI39_contig605g00004 [Zymoseptoria brevis]|uniref:Uncharacterized protein n=1 Tax=Zymoseptoria brevis TaxID=1047168 RepID=A0A0F4GKI7_9PEZI|nr:hypothetical protein TI39_contig605g00004 [Zymoseptoria brevis]